MKNLFNAFKLFAIAITIFGFGNRLMGQAAANYEIDDGGSVLFNAGTYTGTLLSTTTSQLSTARLSNSGLVNLQGTYSDYYGFIRPLEGGILNLNSSTFGSKLEIGQSSYVSQAYLRIGKDGGVTLSGSAGANVIVMDKYGVLDISKDLTLTLGAIMLNNHNDLNAPYIQFHIRTTTPRITFSEGSQTIKTDDATTPNQINVPTNLKFDMSSASTSSIGENSFTVASFSGGVPVLTGSPVLTGDDDGLWENPFLDIFLSSQLRLNATFAPLFDIDGGGSSYAGSLAGLSVRTPSAFQKLLKTKALTGAYSVDADLLINLQAYNLTGDQTFTINSSKLLGLKGTGNFANVVSFGDATSQLQIIGAFASAQMPSVSASSSASGTIVVGDGTDTSTLIVNAALNTKFNSKVDKIVVKNNATVTVTP